MRRPCTSFRAEAVQNTRLPQDGIILEGLKVFFSMSSVGAVHERHMQLDRRVGDKAHVMEYLVYLDEQRFGPRWANPHNMGTTAGLPLEDVERVESESCGRVCEREKCLETVKGGPA